MSKNRTIGMWLYQNGGGDIIQKKMIKKLKERDINTIPHLNLYSQLLPQPTMYYIIKFFSYQFIFNVKTLHLIQN